VLFRSQDTWLMDQAIFFIPTPVQIIPTSCPSAQPDSNMDRKWILFRLLMKSQLLIGLKCHLKWKMTVEKAWWGNWENRIFLFKTWFQSLKGLERHLKSAIWLFFLYRFCYLIWLWSIWHRISGEQKNQKQIRI
jgi:hypothetical protein